MSDYIHRVGRVGRLSSQTSGKVISLVGHRPEVNLVWQIEVSLKNTGSYSRYLLRLGVISTPEE